MAEDQTLGRAISEARRAMGISQKELASQIQREDGMGSISPQYLNDIEHNRRVPGTDHMIQQFATALGISQNFLSVLANRVPARLRDLGLSSEAIDQLVERAVAFRRGSDPKSGK